MTRAALAFSFALVLFLVALGLVAIGLGTTGVPGIPAAGSEASSAAGGDDADSPAVASVVANGSYGRLHPYFEANQGQTVPAVRFLSHGRGYTLFLTPSEAVLSLRSREPAVLRMKLLGADPDSEVVGLERLAGKSNYLSGRPENWRTGIPHYARVGYREPYPGIDMVMYGSEGGLEYDFVVAPAADPGLIRLRFEGAEGLLIDDDGDLVVQVPGGEILQQAPIIYQEIEGVRRTVTGGYLLDGSGEVGFSLGEYDSTHPLVIDPVLAYSTYLGSGGPDFPEDITVDSNGYAYVTGRIESSSFPTPGQTIGAPNTSDVLVAKFNQAGDALVYATFVSGGVGAAITVDPAGRTTVVGSTGSVNFTTVNAHQSVYGGGGRDAVLLRLNYQGTKLIYSTFLGGSDSDYARGVALDAMGQAYVVGDTLSTDFRTMNAVLPQLKGARDAFVASYAVVGAQAYSTFLGGSGDENGEDIAVSGTGDAYVTGLTESSDFPTLSSFQGDLGAHADAFVTRLTPVGGLTYSTYLGGNANFDHGFGIDIDSSGDAYVAGYTNSSDFPTVAAFDGTRDGACRNFIARVKSSGDSLVFSTYLGGSSPAYVDCGSWGNDIALGPGGHVYVLGTTESPDFPTAAAIFGAKSGGNDATLTRLDALGQSLIYSTFLGGSLDDQGGDLAVDSGGNAYLLGSTLSVDFPTLSAYQATKALDQDMFVAKISGGLLDFFIAATPEGHERFLRSRSAVR